MKVKISNGFWGTERTPEELEEDDNFEIQDIDIFPEDGCIVIKSIHGGFHMSMEKEDFERFIEHGQKFLEGE